MGENGSGKSTLLKLIAGILRPESGSVCIDGLDAATLGPKERARHVSYLPQRFGAAFNIDVIDVVLMGINPELGLGQSPSEKHRKLAADALRRLNMEEFSGKSFSELSEGQKQMVMIARSVVQKAPLLLFDEPDSALDINNRRHMMENLRDVIGTEKGALMILHDQQLALSYCDRIYLTKKGVISGIIMRKEATAQSVQEEMNKVFGNVRVFSVDGQFLIGYRQY